MIIGSSSKEINQEENEKEEPKDTEQDEEGNNEDTSSGGADSEQKENTADEKQTETSTNSNFDSLVAWMEEETEGTAAPLFENDETQTHEMEDVTVTLNAYQLVELKDIHTDFSIPFDDQTDGGVLLTEFTVKNDSDQDLYYTPDYYVNYFGGNKTTGINRNLIPLDEQLSDMISVPNEQLLEAGKEYTGYLAHSFGEEQLEGILEEGNVTIEISTPFTDAEEVSKEFTVGQSTELTLPLTDESAEKSAKVESEDFYQDKISKDNMGDKKMIEQEDGIGESDELGDVTITLDGYQFVDFTPNEYEADRFEDPDNLVVATVRFEIDNQGDQEIGMDNTSSRIFLNDGTQYLRNESFLSPYEYEENIAAGEKGELLQTFLLDKEMYEKIWKDKSIEIEIGPMNNLDYEDISKGHVVTFDLK
ncbi:DUF5068 domain-containing protein [Oceanobacillus sp. J11TS1]|uniref:DUF5068 domain-containing protein n=1 Tax=Oceanobacillus sp. J11TS1 TaxID=2807191 RepID=UPI001B1471B5|nr:DUF5068 domain-containing protein [Oceanobacillus sp. J11TS1]GIO23682.1 hypothetical protein J11TS1_22630 [Oceanobacillus sp. J11TS1]